MTTISPEKQFPFECSELWSKLPESLPKPKAQRGGARLGGGSLSIESQSICPPRKLSDLSAVNFKQWAGWPSQSNDYRPNRPVNMLTKRLLDFYQNVSYTNSAKSSNNPRNNPGKNPEPVRISRFEKMMAKRENRFSLEPGDLLGEGSYGAVFEGEDRMCKQAIAVKNFSNRNAAEAELAIAPIWRCLPHVVTIYGYSQHPPMIFMEKLPIPPSRAGSDKTMRNVEDIISIATQLLETHKKASSLGLVHGDIKSNNLFFDGKKVKIFDFSQSHYPEKMQHKILTNCYFQAPEITLGRRYDTSIDMWAIGCLLFEEFIGEPFIDGPWHVAPESHAVSQITQRIGLPSVEWAKQGKKFNEFFACNEDSVLQVKLPPKNIQRVAADDCIIRRFRKSVPYSAHPAFWAAQEKLFVELLSSMLRYENRITADKALQICEQLDRNLKNK